MSMAQPITPTVFVVDDDEALREALTQLLENAGLAVEAFAAGPAFLAAYGEGRPGCLLLDVAMPGMSGLEVQAELKQRDLKIPIVFLTGHGDIPMAVKAVQSGATDFLEKPFHADVLVERIQKALALDVECRQMEQQSSSIRQRHDQLTSREREVMALVVDGFSSKEIAIELGISFRTVEVHRTHVMHKMAAGNLAELVNLAAFCRG
jgi:two-component system response regulator FixJ